jgi:lipopolysaccharide export system permease protein
VAEAASPLELHPGQAVSGKFFNGYYYLLDNRKQQDVTLRFKELAINVPFGEEQANYRRKAVSTGDLAVSRRPKDVAEFQWRMSTPVATLLLALTAVPLARSKPRESRFRIFIAAIALYVGVFSLASVARTWVEQGIIGSIPGLWGVYLVLGLVLLTLLKPRV